MVLWMSCDNMEDIYVVMWSSGDLVYSEVGG